MINIRQRISIAVTDFEIYSGKRPNAIYLGQNEHAALMSWYEIHNYKPGQPNKRLIRFMGIKVYKIVDKVSHLGVGLCQE
jgi:hypothetical protein